MVDYTEAGDEGSDADARLRRRVRRRAVLLVKVVDLDNGTPAAAAAMLQEVLRVAHAVNELIAARLVD